MQPRIAILFLGLAVTLLAVGAHSLPAQQPAATPQAAAQPQVPDPDKLRILIRTTLVALNHANQTGNYTVLRDLGAPGFQSANSAAKLGEIFNALRGRNLDLGPLVVVEPKLVRPAAIADQGMLRITGFFPTKPEQVNFDLVFEPVGAQWRLFGLAVNTSPAQAAAAAATPQPAKPAEPAKPGAAKPEAAKPETATPPKPEAAKPQDKKPAGASRWRGSGASPGALSAPPKP